MTREVFSVAEVAEVAEMFHIEDIGPLPPVATDGGFVYFIRCETTDGYIKIGRSVDLARRLTDMQMHCPYRLRVAAYLWTPDPVALEWKMHVFHSRDRIHGEWFRPSPKLLATVASTRMAMDDLRAQEAADAAAEAEAAAARVEVERLARRERDAFEWRGKRRYPR